MKRCQRHEVAEVEAAVLGLPEPLLDDVLEARGLMFVDLAHGYVAAVVLGEGCPPQAGLDAAVVVGNRVILWTRNNWIAQQILLYEGGVHRWVASLTSDSQRRIF